MAVNPALSNVITAPPPTGTLDKRRTYYWNSMGVPNLILSRGHCHDHFVLVSRLARPFLNSLASANLMAYVVFLGAMVSVVGVGVFRIATMEMTTKVPTVEESFAKRILTL